MFNSPSEKQIIESLKRHFKLQLFDKAFLELNKFNNKDLTAFLNENSWFRSEISNSSLKAYFKLTGLNKFNKFKNLEVFLIENFTETYAQAVRKNKEFLNDERINFWNENNFESFSQNLKIWNAINLKEKKYWDKCEILLDQVKCFSPSNFILALTKALNFKKDELKNYDSTKVLPRLSRSVDVILEYYLIDNI